MIQVKQFTHYYGKMKAVDNVSFEVRRGEIVGFLGANGAGKTTTLKAITGCISPAFGEIFIGGHNLCHEAQLTKKMVGFLPETPPLYLDMTVMEYLRFSSQLKAISPDMRAEKISKTMEKTGLNSVSGRLIQNLSKGYRQRVGIAQAILDDPPFIILDEPTSGLDPLQIADIRALFREMGKEHAVLFSTHILSEIESVADRILIMKQGKLIAQGTPKELLEKYNDKHLFSLLVRAPETEVVEMLSMIKGLRIQSCVSESAAVRLHVQMEEAAIREQICTSILSHNWTILEAFWIPVPLEDVFISAIANAQ